MKKLSFFLIGFFLIPTLFLTSCDRGDDLVTNNGSNSTPAFTLMKEYMINNNLDIDKILTNVDGAKFVAGAPAEADLQTFLDKYYIVDIRNSADFANGHIEGAKNVPLADLLTEAPNANGQAILIVCYTGQTACYGTGLLRLAGYSNTQALKWGMSGWNPATAGSWNNSIASPAEGHANWSFSAEPAHIVFSDPTMTTFETDGQQILNDRIALVLSEGFKGINGIDVLNSPSNYFINNYFSAADYQGFGHIVDAYRFKEDLLLINNGYQEIDPAADAQVANYCYTGQTSAVLTAWMRVLGYDAYSVKFGMNGLYNSNPAWTANQWSSAVSKNLPIVSN